MLLPFGALAFGATLYGEDVTVRALAGRYWCPPAADSRDSRRAGTRERSALRRPQGRPGEFRGPVRGAAPMFEGAVDGRSPMSRDRTSTALDRSTYAATSLAGDSFYVEPPSVPAGLTLRTIGGGAPRRPRVAAGCASSESLHSPPAPEHLGALFLAMSYVIVRVGGKQYRVEKGDSIVVDRMRAGEGDKVDLEPLMYADGDKSLLDAGELGRIKVKATVTGHERGKKIHGQVQAPARLQAPLR